MNLEFDRSTLFGRQDREGDFTAVTAFNVLHYLEDIEKAARRISDLLAPGGLFISATACLGERRTVLGAAARILPMLRITPSARFLEESELADLIARSGFRIVETAELSRLPDYFIVAKKIEATAGPRPTSR